MFPADHVSLVPKLPDLDLSLISQNQSTRIPGVDDIVDGVRGRSTLVGTIAHSASGGPDVTLVPTGNPHFD